MRIVLLICLLLMSMGTAAQEVVVTREETRAASLEVRYGEVEIRRTNTEEWLLLPVGAITPVGEGDAIRTGDRGRAYLGFQNDGEILLLPSSTLMIERYRYQQDNQGESVSFHGSLVGVMVQRWNVTYFGYELTLEDPDTLLLDTGGSPSAVWAIPDQPDAIAIPTRYADITQNGETQTFEGGGVIWLDNPPQFVPMEQPLNAARAEAQLLGCDALVETMGANGVNVRRGIGQLNEKLGLIPDGATVRAMAINESRFWIRIQYLSAFSWVVLDALEIDCPDLRVLPDQTRPERLLAAVNVLDSEIPLLEPFFGLPADDPFFYLIVP